MADIAVPAILGVCALGGCIYWLRRRQQSLQQRAQEVQIEYQNAVTIGNSHSNLNLIQIETPSLPALPTFFPPPLPYYPPPPPPPTYWPTTPQAPYWPPQPQPAYYPARDPAEAAKAEAASERAKAVAATAALERATRVAAATETAIATETAKSQADAARVKAEAEIERIKSESALERARSEAAQESIRTQMDAERARYELELQHREERATANAEIDSLKRQLDGVVRENSAKKNSGRDTLTEKRLRALEEERIRAEMKEVAQRQALEESQAIRDSAVRDADHIRKVAQEDARRESMARSTSALLAQSAASLPADRPSIVNLYIVNGLTKIGEDPLAPVFAALNQQLVGTAEAGPNAPADAPGAEDSSTNDDHDRIRRAEETLLKLFSDKLALERKEAILTRGPAVEGGDATAAAVTAADLVDLRQQMDLVQSNFERVQAGLNDTLTLVKQDHDTNLGVLKTIKEQMDKYNECMKEVEARRAGHTKIIESDAHDAYYRCYLECLNATYQAALMIKSDDVSVDVSQTGRNNPLGMFGTIVSKVGNAASTILNMLAVPIAGTAVSITTTLVGCIAKWSGEKAVRTRLDTLTQTFPHPPRWFSIAEMAAAKATELNWVFIENPKAYQQRQQQQQQQQQPQPQQPSLGTGGASKMETFRNKMAAYFSTQPPRSDVQQLAIDHAMIVMDVIVAQNLALRKLDNDAVIVTRIMDGAQAIIAPVMAGKATLDDAEQQVSLAHAQAQRQERIQKVAAINKNAADKRVTVRTCAQRTQDGAGVIIKTTPDSMAELKALVQGIVGFPVAQVRMVEGGAIVTDAFNLRDKDVVFVTTEVEEREKFQSQA